MPPVWKGTTQITRNLFISVLIFNTISSCHWCSAPISSMHFCNVCTVSVSRVWWLWPLLVSASKHPNSLCSHHQLQPFPWWRTGSVHPKYFIANACSCESSESCHETYTLDVWEAHILTTVIHLTWCAPITQIPTFNRVQLDEISF